MPLILTTQSRRVHSSSGRKRRWSWCCSDYQGSNAGRGGNRPVSEAAELSNQDTLSPKDVGKSGIQISPFVFSIKTILCSSSGFLIPGFTSLLKARATNVMPPFALPSDLAFFSPSYDLTHGSLVGFVPTLSPRSC